MGSFAIRIVVTKDSQKEQIKKAAEAVQGTGLETEKIDGSSVLDLAERDGHMYVCDPFEGDAFNHLVKLGCRVVGPQCVMSCLENELAVPKADHPVYSISMYGVTISCSSVEKTEREKLHKLVQWMGGTVSKNFTDKVTHLVAGEVGSKKYHVAASFKKPIMLPDWVLACWEKGKDRHVRATDDDILVKYSCPIFKGCIICVTGLESDLRRDVSMLTDENGGRYSGELKFNECTHLVVNSPKGPKYEFARKWKIHCVSSKWFFDSIEKNFCQDENLYRVEADVQATSTPNGVAASSRLSAVTSMANFSAISNISMASAVDDTAMTEANLSLAEPRSDMKELDELDLSLTDAGLFLDGCKVFLSGFSGARLEKLRKIINTGGATRFNQINESVSHVVMGRKVPEHIDLLMQSSYRPHVVNAMWLVDSFKRTTQATEENYICLNLPPLTSASPANQSRPEKRGLSLGKKQSKERPKKSVTRAEEDAEDADMMQQYLPGVTDQNETTNDSEVVFNLPQERDPELTRGSLDDDDATQMDGDANSEEEVTILEEQTDGIFAGKSFVILGFPPEQEEQILDMLITNGGKVKATGSRGIADFAVVPINGCKVNVSVHEVISNCWLQMCMEENSFLDPASNPLFTPITIMEEASPLCDCVVTISQFSGVERDCLVHIAELLGANCQEYFSRKATEALRPNTHLLLKEPNGSKYKAAKKWKVPAVTKDWLLETARTNKRQPERKFLVDLAPPPQDPSPPKSHIPSSKTDHIGQVSDAGKTSGAGKVSGSSELQSKPQDLDHQNVDQLIEPPDEDRVEKLSRTEEEHLASERQGDSRTSKDVDKNTGVSSARGEASKGDNKENSTSVASKDAPRDTPRDTPRGTPIVNKHLSVSGSGEAWSKDTPSKFLRIGTVFHPTFDTKDALAYLESPAGVHHKKRHTRKSSLPLDDFFHMNIAKALQKTGEQATNEEADESVFHEQVKSKGVLDGVILSVSRKLVSKQAEYNTLAVSLGAEFRWTFDDSCTHFIFKGRANDTSKEFRAAKSKGMCIVSPVWLQACEEEERRVDETTYPHTYNPKMSLSVVSTRRETPSRTPARSSRKTRSMAQSATPCPPRAQARQQPQATPTPRAVPTPQAVPAPQHDETAMDGFGADSTDSDEELMRVAEAAEMGEVVEEDEPEAKDNEEGSLEQRENLQKQLEGFMSSTMNVRGGRRRSRIHKGSTSGIDTSSNSTSAPRDRSGHQETGRRTRSSRAMVHSVDGGQAVGTSRALTVRPPEVHPEASQNVQITWDDPSGRQEREKIMAHLKRSCSPSQNHAQDDDNREVSPRGILRGSTMGGTPFKEDSRDSVVTPPTPKGPSIRLPAANPPVAPQPRKQDTTAADLEEPAMQPPTFLLSGMSQEEKIDYSALIEQLGAVVKDGMYFVPSCTHIVVGNPTRNEKYLACLASGKWVLHKSFLEASRKAGELVEEESHEWGSATDLSTLNDQTAKLALAACRWRRQLQVESENVGYDPELHGAFSGWCVILYIDRQKEAGFKRILQAGGAKIASMRPPFGSLDQVTYAFMDLQKTKTPEGAIDLEAMASAGILCLKPEFIADYLMQDSAPQHSNYFISEVKPIMERLYDNHHSRSSRTPSKRKQPDSVPTPRSKKGRMR